MTRYEFIEELDRLASGFKQEMTPERAEAIWVAIRHRTSLSAWRDAVDRALLDPRFPTGDRLLKFVEDAAETERRSQVRDGRHDPIFPRNISPKVADPAYGQFRLDLNHALLRDGLYPEDIATRLRGAEAIFPAHVARLAEEIASLQAAPKRASGTTRLEAWKGVKLPEGSLGIVERPQEGSEG